MPEIICFYGISIYMYHREHAPAHFHTFYGEYEITVEVESQVITGKFPHRSLNLVMGWYRLHQNELIENGKLAEKKIPLNEIAPLE